MFINNFDPVAINFFSLEIRWYSLAYIFGILAGWVLAKRFFINNQGIKTKFDDYVTYLIFGIIIGGRLGYVLFYNLDYYFKNPIDIFKIWQGGMSFHGGVIGIIIVSVWFANKNKQNVFSYLDVISLVAPIGIFFLNEYLINNLSEQSLNLYSPILLPPDKTIPDSLTLFNQIVSFFSDFLFGKL